MLITLLTPTTALAETTSDFLRWLPSPSSDVVGYVVHIGPNSGFRDSGTGTAIDIGDSFTILDGIAMYPLEGLTQTSAYFVMTAYDVAGLSSVPSNEIFVELLTGCTSNAECIDTNLCNGTESCVAGACVPGTTLSCADPGPCEISSCDAIQGCSLQTVPDGSACDDGDAFTAFDTCFSGICLGSTPSEFPQGSLYQESFDGYLAGEHPAGWLDTGSGNSMIEDPSLFYIVDLGGGNAALETTSLETNIHSHMVAAGSAAWSDYELSGRMMVSDSQSGIGVTVYSDYPGSDLYYRLRRYESQPSFHLASHVPDTLSCTGSTDTGLNPQANAWVHFRFQVLTEGPGARLRGRVWPENGVEPDFWQIDCLAAGAGLLVSGSPGVWAMGAGTKRWDDLRVQPIGSDIVVHEPGCIADSDCSDDDVCNGLEICSDGACLPAISLVCADPGPCSVGYCDAQLGCVTAPSADGIGCSRGDLCTEDDFCSAGACIPGPAVSCAPTGPCEIASCDSGVGCMIETLANGSVCDDGNEDTSSDSCSQGICSGIVVVPEPPASPAPDGNPDLEIPEDGSDLFFEDFESYRSGESPIGWFDTAAGNSLSLSPGLFQTVELASGDMVLTTNSTQTNIHSHLITSESVHWSDYEYSGEMMIGSNAAGIGVTLYSDYPNSDSYYRLRRYDGHPTFHLSHHPDVATSCASGSDTGVDPVPGLSYRFRFQARGFVDGTQIRAKIWLADAPEPSFWQVSCFASGTASFSSGAPGIWSMDAGARYWDDLRVVPVIDRAVEDLPPSDPPASLFSEDFEAYADGADPLGWMDTGAQNSMNEDPSLFEVARLTDGSTVMATFSTRTNIHSHYTTSESKGWSDYEFSGRMLVTRARSGIGVTVFSDYPRSNRYYRLRRYSRRRSFHISSHSAPVCSGVTNSYFNPEPGSWARFRFQAAVEDEGTRLRAKVWAQGEAEPTRWQIDCLSPGVDAPTSGPPGIWAMGRGAKLWDDFEVRPIGE